MQLPESVASRILDTTSDAILVVDGSGALVFVNQRAGELFGYAPAELVGRPVEALIPEESRQRHSTLRAEYEKAPRSRPLLSGMSLDALHSDGHVFKTEIALTPMPSDGRMYVVTTIRPSESAEASDAFHRHLLDAAPDAMITIDPAGRIATVNAQAEGMFGHARAEMLGRDIEMLMPPRFRERHRAHRATYMARPRLREMGANMDLAGLRRDGSEFPVEISLSPIHTSTGLFVASVIRDVTERRRMEQALVSAKQAAERANKANSAFLAAASHDLRQPVQALALLNGALRRAVKEPLAQEMIQSQQDSLDGMTNLLNSLLDISRLDAGAVQPEIEDFPLQRLIGRLAAESSRQAKKKKLAFAAVPTDFVVTSDPNLLTEIVQNFVSNAIRYTERGTVTLSCREVGDQAWITVTDTGIGIEADQFENIFREFHQIRTGSDKREGFGLGLAITRRLADLLGQEIAVESTPGHGSSFSVSVPLAPSRPLPDTAGRGVEQAELSSAERGTILLIEDDDKVSNAWSLLLRSEGHRVVIAASADEARRRLRELGEPPQLVISDFHLLDGSNGIEAISAIRSDLGVDMPAFVITGDTSKIVQDDQRLANCMIMRKPVGPDLLLRMARDAVASGSVPD